MIASNGGASMLLDVRHRLLLSLAPASPTILPSTWNTTSPTLQNPKPLQQQHCIRCWRSGSNWGSNAENVRAGRYRFRGEAERGPRREKRKWWSDADEDEGEGEDESLEFEEDADSLDDELWDTFWIFKVLRSYGWMLPAIITSMLLASGPKAFLMALALPLGQSVLSLAVDKVWESMQDRPKRKSRSKKKRDNGESSSGDQRWGYKTWVASDDGLIDKDNRQRPSSFGGWDELDCRGETDNKVPGKQPDRTISRPSQPRPQKRKLRRRMKNSGAPLLLRLLIAIFPFLSSWTKIL